MYHLIRIVSFQALSLIHSGITLRRYVILREMFDLLNKQNISVLFISYNINLCSILKTIMILWR